MVPILMLIVGLEWGIKWLLSQEAWNSPVGRKILTEWAPIMDKMQWMLQGKRHWELQKKWLNGEPHLMLGGFRIFLRKWHLIESAEWEGINSGKGRSGGVWGTVESWKNWVMWAKQSTGSEWQVKSRPFSLMSWHFCDTQWAFLFMTTPPPQQKSKRNRKDILGEVGASMLKQCVLQLFCVLLNSNSICWSCALH